jgi:hypothetical protein
MDLHDIFGKEGIHRILPFDCEMDVDSTKNEVALKNLNVLCDIDLILGFPCILPLLDIVHMLIKIAQGRNVFVCDFVNDVKSVQ